MLVTFVDDGAMEEIAPKRKMEVNRWIFEEGKRLQSGEFVEGSEDFRSLDMGRYVRNCKVGRQCIWRFVGYCPVFN